MLLTIRQLQVTYGKQTALQIQTPITFERGDRIGVIGSNGAGKTTLVKALLGLAPYQGSIVTELKPEQMAVHMQFNEYVTTMPVKIYYGDHPEHQDKIRQPAAGADPFF